MIKLTLPQGSSNIRTCNDTSIDFAHIRNHKMKKLMTDTPYEFLMALINSMEISVGEWTEVYKSYPEMFEDLDELTIKKNGNVGIGV